MKKFALALSLFAFTGFYTAEAALASISTEVVSNDNKDDKKKDKKKKKDGEHCAPKAEAKAGCATEAKAGKSCCAKKGGEAKAEAPATK